MTDARYQAVPAGTVDAHMHLYAPGLHKGSTPFSVAHAELPAYQAVMKHVGIDRVVFVQSMLYGDDNTTMLSGLEALGDRARGIAVTQADATDTLWDQLASQGVIGLRAFMLKGGFLSWDELPRLSARLAERNWQLHLQFNGRELADRAALLSEIQCPLVIDHVGKFLSPVEPEAPAFKALLDLLAAGKTWVKLSGLYETSVTGAPDYEDTARLARIVAKEAPNRVLWASNWPHPNLQPAPDDRTLVDLVRRIVPGEAEQQLLFVQNAAELFGFKGASA